MPDAAQELMALRKRAADLDERRQLQINNQRASIDRLLQRLGTDDAEAAGREIARLNEELAAAQQKLAQAQ